MVPLRLVLDLDGTLLSESGGHLSKVHYRPHVAIFLYEVSFRFAGVGILSAAKSHWVRFLTSQLTPYLAPGKSFEFVYAKEKCMLVERIQPDEKVKKIHIKPLSDLWKLHPTWTPMNTLAIDNHVTTFEFNKANGVPVPTYLVHHKNEDDVLIRLLFYLDTMILKPWKESQKAPAFARESKEEGPSVEAPLNVTLRNHSSWLQWTYDRNYDFGLYFQALLVHHQNLFGSTREPLRTTVPHILLPAHPAKERGLVAALDGFPREGPHPLPTQVVFAKLPHPPPLQWVSPHAEGQPMGPHQTGYGSLWRARSLRDLYAKEHPECAPTMRTWTSMAVENGQLTPTQAGVPLLPDEPPHQLHMDTTYVALVNEQQSITIVEPGVPIRQPCKAIWGEHPEKDEAFQEEIRKFAITLKPWMEQDLDFYEQWAKEQPQRPRRPQEQKEETKEAPHPTRIDYIRNTCKRVFRVRELILQARSILYTCAQLGFSASADAKYAGSTWMRDLAYCLPAYRTIGIPTPDLLGVLQTLGSRALQKQGQVPIVCFLTPDLERMFLYNRLLSWREACLKGPTCGISSSPDIPKDASLVDLQLTSQLWMEHWNLHHPIRGVLHELCPCADPSFFLLQYMTGNLSQLTAGTRDSELHYLRSVFSLMGPLSVDQVSHLAAPAASVLAYVLQWVLHASGLPLGADQRDIWADVLDTSRAYTNAAFWKQALLGLRDHAQVLDQTLFADHFLQALRKIQVAGNPSLHVLRWKAHLEIHASLGTLFQEELNTLRDQMKFFEGPKATLRDFFPGPTAHVSSARSASPPLAPDLFDLLVSRVSFLDGTEMDIQGYSWWVLDTVETWKQQGFMTEEDQEKAEQMLAQFRTQESPIGYTAFVPMSVPSSSIHRAAIKEQGGRLMWPHLGWQAIQALLALASCPYLKRSTRDEAIGRVNHHSHVLHLVGLGEWYVTHTENPDSAIQGGSTCQGWSAALFIQTQIKRVNYYQLNPHER